MQFAIRTAIIMSLFVGAGCTATSDTPATIPTSTASVTTVVPATVVSTTTTSLATTTTVDRLTEIAAIFEDLEKRRLQAIFDQDEEAFRAVHANEQYLEESLIVLDLAKVLDPRAEFYQIATSLVADEAVCIAAELERSYEGVLKAGATTTKIYVAELHFGNWGLSWVGEGWACDGPHPLS